MQNPLKDLTAPAQSVPFSAQAAVGVFLAYIFLVIGGGVSLFTGFLGEVSLHFEGLIPLSGALVIFLSERANRFVRFHAAQALVIGGAWIVVQLVFGILESIDALYRVIFYLDQFLYIAFILLVVYTLYRAAYRSEIYKLPVIGGIAQSLIGGPVV